MSNGKGLLQDLDQMGKEYGYGDRNFAQLIAGIANRGVAQPLGEAISAVTPDFIEEPINAGVNKLADATGFTDWFESLDAERQRDIVEFSGAASLLPGGVFLKSAAGKVPQVALPNQVKVPSTGMTRASGDVMIPGFYSNNPAEKIAGVAKFGVKGVGDVAMNMLDPRRAAMYKEYGIGPRSKVYGDQLKKVNKQIEDLGIEGKADKVRTDLANERYKETLSTLRQGYVESQLKLKEKLAENLAKGKKDKGKAITNLEDKIKKQKQALADFRKKPKAEMLEEIKASKGFNASSILYKKQEDLAEKFQSQLQATSNIRTQAGALEPSVANIPESASRMASALKGKTFFTKKDVGEDWYNSTANVVVDPDLGEAKKGAKKAVSDEMAGNFQSLIEDTWKRADNLDIDNSHLFVKKPGGKYTGNHQRDANFGPIPVALQNIFTGGEGAVKTKSYTDNRQLLAALNEQKNKLAKGDSGTFNVVREDANGFYVQFSKKGSAKVEGGVNIITHVDRNGTLTSVISDKHDIATPKWMKPVGAYLDYSLDQELSVTPPIQKKITPSGMRTTNTSGGISIGEAEGFASYVSNLKPSKSAVAKETASRVGAGMLGLQALQQEEEQ